MTNNEFRITVIGGAGYVGLITGLGFAQFGHNYNSIFIAVGSPRRQDGSTNLAQLREAIHELADIHPHTPPTYNWRCGGPPPV